MLKKLVSLVKETKAGNKMYRAKAIEIREREVDSEVFEMLPEFARKILKGLDEVEMQFCIKGGFARIVLLVIISTFYNESRKLRDVHKRIATEERFFNDLDIAIFHSGRLGQYKEYLLNCEKRLFEALSGIINIRGEDIEPFRGNLERKTIARVLLSRDLTINQLVLARNPNKKNGWIVYYTPECYQALLHGVGFLSLGGSKTLRLDCRRYIFTNCGFYRLVKLLAFGKINSIYVPYWMPKAHFKEMDRLRKNGEKIPIGATMGNYMLVLLLKCQNADDEIKRRLLYILEYFGFTDGTLSFDKLLEEQSFLYEIKNRKKFLWNKKISFDYTIEKTIKERKESQQGREERNKKRGTCEHVFEEIHCNGCNENCIFQKCEKCNKATGPEELLCNKILRMGNWKGNPQNRAYMPYPGNRISRQAL